jgi:hypothetical protein
MDLVAGIGPFGSIGSIDREALLHAVMSGGGAMLLAYAMYVRASGRASAQQVRGLVAAGIGFLASAAASMYLRGHEVIGPTVSLGGTIAAMYGMLTLVRERRDRLQGREHPRAGRE